MPNAEISFFIVYLPRLLIAIQVSPEASYQNNSKAAMVSNSERTGFVSTP